MDTIDIENRLGIQFCARQPVSIERGEGNTVWDEQGRQYLDFTSGWGVTCLGHSHPVITNAITKQAKRILQNPNSGFTYSPARAELLSTLQPLLPDSLKQIYFANSGAEANDAAIKLARKVTGKNKVISTMSAFHGRTYSTLSVSLGEENTRKFLPHVKNTCFIPHGDSDALAEAVDNDTAAFILEPVQGEGGVRIPEQTYLAGIEKICRHHGVLLIVDEIQTGFCRTGKFFALEHSPQPVRPDILTMGKGIAGGLPFAAFAISSQLKSEIRVGDHGGTFCGNPLGCAVASSVVRYLQFHQVADYAAKQGVYLLSELELLVSEYPSVLKAARGIGLLCAIQLESDRMAQYLSALCLEQGLLVTPTRGGIVRLIPSLLVTTQEIEQAMCMLRSALSRIGSLN